MSVEWQNKYANQQTAFSQIWVDENLIETFGIHINRGRFLEGFKGDETKYVINETICLGLFKGGHIKIMHSRNIKRATCLYNGPSKTFPIQKRIEEIGVGRVPGASETGIFR
ncbi:MAG TPA: hypothetical protein VK369_14405, partial [Segetibacter sp.]|nr:hypothetical protein [Segetibacter sp.]